MRKCIRFSKQIYSSLEVDDHIRNSSKHKEPGYLPPLDFQNKDNPDDYYVNHYQLPDQSIPDEPLPVQHALEVNKIQILEEEKAEGSNMRSFFQFGEEQPQLILK